MRKPHLSALLDLFYYFIHSVYDTKSLETSFILVMSPLVLGVCIGDVKQLLWIIHLMDDLNFRDACVWLSKC